MVQTRLLSPADAPALQFYLAAQADCRVMMLNNLERSGIADGEVPYRGVYAGQFDDGELIGCLGFFWNGMVLSHAPSGHAAMLALAQAASPRKLVGVAGPVADVEACIKAVAPHTGMPRQARRETLYGLSLDNMIVPAPLQSGAISVRRAEAGDRDLVIAWRVNMLEETRIGYSAAELHALAQTEMDNLLAAGLVWLAEKDGTPVAKATTIALVAGRACVGGVWTPPALRGQGYARAVVAGQMQHLMRQGISRGVLFTGQQNHQAQRAYEALGFSELGSWAAALFA